MQNKRVMGAAVADGTTLCSAGKGNFAGGWLSNGPTARWVKFYDKATAPASTDTPIVAVYMPANSFIDLGPIWDAIPFALGLGVRMCVNGIDNDATYTAFAANDCALSVLYNLG